MRVTVNGKRRYSTLKVRINPHAWDPVKEKATGEDSITKKLESDGVEKFIEAFDKLMETLTKKTFEKKKEKV
jgi:hypothetical protein